VWDAAVEKGAHAVEAPKTASDDFGVVKLGSIRTYGDTIHTLIERRQYSGAFLPGYRAVKEIDKTAKYLPQVDLLAIDHCVGKWNGYLPVGTLALTDPRQPRLGRDGGCLRVL
jgi:4-hydroxyphenylpyruvate dioxygenase